MQVLQHFGIVFQEERMLSRCCACNGRVCVQRSADDIAGDASVPGHVKESCSEFWACDRCGKTFWCGGRARSAPTCRGW